MERRMYEVLKDNEMIAQFYEIQDALNFIEICIRKYYSEKSIYSVSVLEGKERIC